MNDVIQILIYLSLLIVLTPLLGRYMAKVYLGERHILTPLFGRLENLTYRVCQINAKEDMGWKRYALNLLLFNLLGFITVGVLMIVQHYLPLNPESFKGTSWHLAFNTATSFMTNTNWQAYSGEAVLGYLVQMLGLTVQNFVSAATGMAVIIAVLRGLKAKGAEKLGNFWVDLSRTVIYILMPLSIILAILLLSQGVIQNFSEYKSITTVEGSTQIIPSGPAASQIAIKQLGTNGGGFFGTNSSHPFENPTPFSNFLQVLAILLIPSALTFTFGRLVGSNRQGWTIFITMFILFLFGLMISYWSETGTNHFLNQSINMEGKETRIGVGNSVLWSVATTDASNGSVNAMHDSMTPLSGMIALFNIMLGEVIFGGVGSGLYGMVVFIVLTVFIAGLMVGRTPEYLGKKIEAFEVKMAILAVLAPCASILIFSAIACVIPMGLSSLNNTGPHGLSQILYAFSSAAGNNGSAFAGLNVNTPFYNITLGIAMLIGRFGVIIPVLAIAGEMAGKKITPLSSGTFRTDNWLFIILLISVILIVGGLTFFPALALGPVSEHLLMNMGVGF
jgi:potassium-transporting ATPase potassium-binding subunit